MEWLQRIYENAMANMERRTGAYEDPENQWGFLLAILGAIAVGFAINHMLKKKKRGGGRGDQGGDQGNGDDAKW